MAQFNSLLVTGDSRFINPINGNARNGIYYVKGTQTVATGSWTGVIPVPALYDGLTISYYLPYAGSGNATLNLTLSDGTTTGAINCYYQGNSRLTTHYGTGSNIMLTYHPAGAVSVNGTATTDNRWVAGQNFADGNDTAYQVRDYYNRFVAGANKVFPYTIIMQNADGRWESIVTSSSTGTSKARNTHGFRLGQIALMYANATYNENAIIGDATVYESYTSGLIDHRYSFNTANNSTNGTTAVKPVYLVGALNATDGLFYLDTTWWTQTLPTTANGKLYIYLGDAYDYYRMSFRIHHPIYWYSNGKVREFHQDSATVNGHTVDKDVPSDAKFTDNNTTYTFANGTNGFTVTPSGGSAQTVTVTPSITNNVTGSGTSGYLTKFNGANTITTGPKLGSSTTTYLRNDGSWTTPVGTTYSAGTGMSLSGTTFSTKIWEGTQTQYDAITTPDPDTTYFITDSSLPVLTATNVNYSNVNSGLSATTVQGAIDEVNGVKYGYTTISSSITVDLNDLTDNGIYSVYNPTNKPYSGNAWAQVIVIKAANEPSYATQICLGNSNTPTLYVRVCTAGTWQSWVKIDDSPDVGTLTAGTGVTITRGNVSKLGKLVSIAGNITVTATISSGATIASFPSALNISVPSAFDFVIYSSSGKGNICYAYQNNLIANSTIPTGTYVFNATFMCS